MTGRHARVAAAIGLGAAMVASFSMVGSAAFGKNNKPSAAQYQYKVTLCHRTKSQKKGSVTITVSSRAVNAHLRHGDKLGACNSGQSSSASPSSHGNGNGKGHGQGQGKGHGKDR